MNPPYDSWIIRDKLENCMVVEDHKTYDETMKEDGINIWVADTAATCHVGCILIGMTDTRPSDMNTRVENGQKMNGNIKGDINVTYVGLMDGIYHNVRLTNYMFASNLKYNL